ncbi:lysophospholipase [Sphingomonas guangdongensis]|uniref:Lysophospholipase n=1 Tax=Sphingomonas guangdongensis TaxID=1141890 RepID=A0A285QAL4_9SPHN|nr:alpha/beta hydrolase [Sphingomonas guangdongensis]SOB78548.1 lysophospholipase [Sphingomonas guangdongensis]
MSDAASPASHRRAIPADARVDGFVLADGWPLRRFDWPAAGTTRGAILFQCGRGDFFEKYLESFAHWHARGWHVTTLDWRGQAGSGRTGPAAHVGHIDDFDAYLHDLGAIWDDWRARAAGPRVLFGHSMGGHLALRALAAQLVDPDAAVLIAPMLGLRAPVGARLGQTVARLMARVGDPARAAWKGNERPDTLLSRAALLTHDADRYADELWWQAQDPRLLTGPPSWTWLAEAFRSTAELNASPTLATVKTPVLLLVAEADRLVDPHATIAVARRLPDAEIVRFGAEAAHELLREADPVRARALAAIDAFLDARASPR